MNGGRPLGTVLSSLLLCIFGGLLLLLCGQTFTGVLCEESMEHELRPPEEGVDSCFPLQQQPQQQFVDDEHKNGATIVLGGQRCPVSNQFWYYKCCGQHGNICCLQLQPMSWLLLGILVPVAIGLLALQLLCGLFTLCCKICCCCCWHRRHKSDQ